MLERGSVQVREERNARKDPLDEKAVRGLLKRVGEVVIAKGKKTVESPQRPQAS